MSSNTGEAMAEYRVFTRTAEVSVWWLLKTVIGLGTIPIAFGIIGFFLGESHEVMIGMISGGLMVLLGGAVSGAILLLEPEVVLDDL